MKKIRLLLADDQVLFVESLKIVLDVRTTDIEVLGTAGDGQEAIEMAGALLPDVILMDVRMPVLDGVEATRVITESYPGINIMMLTTFEDDAYVTKALDHGAAGYVLKDTPPDQLIVSIHAVHNGSVLISPQVANRLLRNRTGRGTATPSEQVNHPLEEHSLLRFLSPREIDVLRLIGDGCDNTLIAKKLTIAEQTVKNHVSVIYSKLNIHDRIRVMKLASNLKDYLRR